MPLSTRSLVLLVATVSMVLGHSMLMCTKYDKTTGKCYGAVRNAGVSIMQEDSVWDQNQNAICQSAWANPITSYYSNGASCPDWAPCPDAMGTFTPGETFSVMWFARNHAIGEQNPGNVQVYLSPKESVNQGADVTANTFFNNLLCEGSYSNCLGPNVDKTPCVLTCTIPANAPSGIYTMLWYWHWINGAQNRYVTCADINVMGTGSSSGNSSAPATQPPATQPPATQPPATQPPATKPPAAPATTGKATKAPTPATQPPATKPPATQPPATTPPASSGSCTLGNQRCVDGNPSVYQTCTYTSRTETGWSQNQSCPKGLKCSVVQGNHIWCV